MYMYTGVCKMPTSQSESFLLLSSLVHSVVELVDTCACLMISVAYYLRRRVEVVFVCMFCSVLSNALSETGCIYACLELNKL